MTLSRSLVERAPVEAGDNQQGSILRRSLASSARSVLGTANLFLEHLGTAASRPRPT
jgi:hypothetical protein